MTMTSTPPNILNKTIQHENGTLAYSVRIPANNPTAVPILMIQGVGVHGKGWLPQAHQLGHTFRVITFDNRGIGKSLPMPTMPISVEQMADDALAILNAERLTAHVVGHSLGGLAAMHLALTARERVRSLALMCTVAKGLDAAKLKGADFWLALRTRVGPESWRRRAFLQMVFPPDIWDNYLTDKKMEELADLFGHDLAEQPPIVKKQLTALKNYDATPRLKELAGIPTLVMSGRHDRIARPELGKALAEGIPNARFMEFATASHALPIQLPAQVNDQLHTHILRVENSLPRSAP
jgi:pimeloyl-ACP methyl ester carboxylesterase